MNSGGKILVVDDEESTRTLCRTILQVLGYDVTPAMDPEHALTLLTQKPFDVVLTDIRMPGAVDGIHLAEEVRTRYPGIDVIVMTGMPSIKSAVAALKAGAYDYVIKPFDPEMLVSVIRRCLEKRRLTVQLDKEKSMRQEMEAAYHELQKVEQMKEAIVGRVNHELRTPLVPILVSLSMLESGSLDEESKKHCAWLRDGVMQLQRLIEELLTFSEVRGKELTLNRSIISLPSILKEIEEEYGSLAKTKQISMDVQLAQSADSVWADERLLRIAFKHLLFNAIRFNKAGGRIQIVSRMDKNHLEIAFSDTGIGIPQDKLSKVFDSFYQVAEYLTREIGGLGLGLAIVRRIVEAHGGLVLVQSEPGQGSVFKVYLPCQTPAGASTPAPTVPRPV